MQITNFSFKELYRSDIQRYNGRCGGYIRRLIKYYRKSQTASNPIKYIIYKCMFIYLRKRRNIELSDKCKIGPGLYLGHACNITINPKVVIGKNCNIHKGVTIGEENRGRRKGTPIIGDEVWIGINAVIVGKIRIGNDVLISPNSFVNCNVPDHSVVFGNPCIIKHRDWATEGYINNKCTLAEF